MRKALVASLVGLGLVAAAGLATTSAAPSPSTTVVFSCDRGVGTASASVQLYDQLGGTQFDSVNLSCGPDSTSGLKSERTKVFTGDAGWFVANISLTNGLGSGGCGIGSVAPSTQTCDLAAGGGGVKLTVR